MDLELTETKAETTGVSLFPIHKEIIKRLAHRDRRTFSNALQVIIEQWYGDHAAQLKDDAA